MFPTEHVTLSEKKDNDETFIDLNEIRLDGSIREVDPPKHVSKPTLQSRSKLVISLFLWKS